MGDYSKTEQVIGLDLGDEWSHYHVLKGGEEVGVKGRVKTRRAEVEQWGRQQEGSRVVMEAGTHSPWMSRLLEACGHEVVVANPRKVQLITKNMKKRDPVDARLLARLGRVDVELLSPVKHRSAEAQQDLAVLRARDMAVRVRSQLILHVRGAVKAVGGRVGSCTTGSFATRAAEQMPAELRPALLPLLEAVVALNQQIRHYDQTIEELGQQRYAVTQRLRTVPGVGPVTSLAFVLVVDDPRRFRSSRAVGSYVGLHAGSRQSGEQDPQLPITKQGDAFLRRLLVNSAQYVLGPFGPDSDLRQWGLRLAGRGGKNAKKRAVVAVARKLAVLLHHLWVSGEVYEAFYRSNGQAAAA
jgi:transposase